MRASKAHFVAALAPARAGHCRHSPIDGNERAIVVPLSVLLDGVPLPAPDARSLWQRFSTWMEERRGDLAGFAEAEGFASVHPEIHGGEPVLVVSRTLAQKPYTSAATKRGRPTGGPTAPPRPGRRRRAR
jgi:hypothetical protein